jgi:hypothetical protein
MASGLVRSTKIKISSLLTTQEEDSHHSLSTSNYFLITDNQLSKLMGRKRSNSSSRIEAG